MEKRKRSLLIFILGLLCAIGPFSIDMYLPGFPTIAADLNTTVDYVAYSLSSFFIGICAGQLICGPLLDRFGRKTPLYVGLVLYILASIGCSLSNSVESLIAFRFLQALGGCVGMVAPNAIVRDVFPVDENAKIFSLLILILGVSPILAPTIGSYIIAGWGWEPVFILLAIVAFLILLLVIRWLPESKQPDHTFSLRARPILRSYADVLKQTQFTTYAFSGATAASGLFAYLAGSPFVFMEMYHVTEQQYGWIFSAIAAGLIGCSQLNNVMLKKYNSAQIIRVVLLLQTVTGLLLVTGTAAGILGLYSTILLMFFIFKLPGIYLSECCGVSDGSFQQRRWQCICFNGSNTNGFRCYSFRNGWCIL